MDQDDEFEQIVRIMIIEIMMILYKNNITQVHMGGLLRLLGISNVEASLRDDELLELDENFAKYIKVFTDLSSATTQNQTLH